MHHKSIPSNGYNNETSTLKHEVFNMNTRLLELQNSLDRAQLDEEQKFIHDRENDCMVKLEEYVERKVKEILPTATLQQDILETLTLGMIKKFAVKEVDQVYHEHIMKDFVTNNPIHDMLFYAIYAAFSEAVLQMHRTHERVNQVDPAIAAKDALNDAAPVPCLAEYLRDFNSLVQTYARLYPHRLGNPPANADKEENSQQ